MGKLTTITLACNTFKSNQNRNETSTPGKKKREDFIDGTVVVFNCRWLL